MEVTDCHIGFHGSRGGFWLMENDQVVSLKKTGIRSLQIKGLYEIPRGGNGK